MTGKFKEELIEYGKAELHNYAPKELDMEKAARIDILLDRYSGKWLALQDKLNARKIYILNREHANNLPDFDKLPEQLDEAISAVRKIFTSTYPLVF